MRKNVTEDRLEPAHFTVIGYLLAIDPDVIPHLAAYRINSVNEDTYLARNCLTYIGLEEFSAPCVLNEEIGRRWREASFREHAIKYWPGYARFHGQDLRVLQLEKLSSHIRATHIARASLILFREF